MAISSLALGLALACSVAFASPDTASVTELRARAPVEDDVASVLAVAYGDNWEADLTALGAEWVSSNATVRTLMGIPAFHNGGAGRGGGFSAAPRSIHNVYAVLADGRRVSVNMQSARLVGLPPSGNNIPVQGVVTSNGTLVLDTVSYYCDDTTAPPFNCSIGSDVDLPFVSNTLAALEASARVGTSVDARLATLGLPSMLDTLGLRPDTRRRAQQNAVNDNALEQFPASESRGVRRVLAFRVFFTGATSSCSNVAATDASVARASATVAQLHGARSFGSLTLAVDVAPCLYYLPNYDTYWTSDAPYYSLMKNAGLGVLKSGDTNGCPAFNLTEPYDHYIMVHPFISTAPYIGLGEAPGRFVWINGQAAVNDCGGGACTMAHEVRGPLHLPPQARGG